ncbi:DinI-like family protein [Enterobacter ludwigii]
MISVHNGTKVDKEMIDEILHETWENVVDWLIR